MYSLWRWLLLAEGMLSSPSHRVRLHYSRSRAKWLSSYSPARSCSQAPCTAACFTQTECLSAGRKHPAIFPKRTASWKTSCAVRLGYATRKSEPFEPSRREARGVEKRGSWPWELTLWKVSIRRRSGIVRIAVATILRIPAIAE